ncbi:MAG: hypothetical protein WC256_07355 [Desulfurivibrionaceae bacterium]|jgi:hypothetical protein
MKIVLHIGTHKTGTSALQSFCGLNREALLDRGVFYPKLANKSNSFNFLAARIAFSQADEVRRFFAEAVKAAQRAHVGTILVSGESFYAMTSLFYRLYDRPCGDYWEHERRCVAALRLCLPKGVEYVIYCYVRRQDLFLESLYNQCVKHTPGFGGDIMEFLGCMHETLDYTRQLEIWGEVFGRDALYVRSYEPVADRLPEDFLAWALNIDHAEGFFPLGDRVNERLSRDLLEYKRILNRIGMLRADAATAMVQIMELSRIMGDVRSYHDYLSPEERQSLLKGFAESRALLTNRHPEAGCLVQDDPSFHPTECSPYPGLSVEAALEIAYRHLRLARQPKERLQAMLRRVYYPLRQRYEFVDILVGSIRNLLRI